MMDVHPPHEPVHGWRDFLLHLLTITIGLLIALSLEGCVEWQHHRHLVREAKENLRQEIEDNQRAVRSDVAKVREAELRMKRNLETLRGFREHNGPKNASLSYSLDWESPSQSSWATARDTGALSYMGYKDVQNYADVYGQQEIANGMAVRLFTDQSTAMAPLFIVEAPDKLTSGELEAMLQGSAGVYTQLKTLEQIITELDQAYTKSLKQPGAR